MAIGDHPDPIETRLLVGGNVMAIGERPDPIETRLLLVAEMLDRAVLELNNVMAEIKQSQQDENEPGAPDG
jgi:hypothetical protein